MLIVGVFIALLIFRMIARKHDEEQNGRKGEEGKLISLREMIQYAECLEMDGREDEALKVYAQMEEKFSASESLELIIELVKGMESEAHIYEEKKEWRKAERVYDRIIQCLGEFNDSAIKKPLATAITGKAIVCAKRGEVERGKHLFKEVLEVFCDEGECFESVMTAAQELSDMCVETGEEKQGEEILVRVIDHWKGKEKEPRYSDLSYLYVDLGIIYNNRKQYDKALQIYKTAADLYSCSLDPMARRNASYAMNNAARLLADQGNMEESEKWVERVENSFDIYEYPEMQERVAISKNCLAESCMDAGMEEKAVKIYTEVVDKYATFWIEDVQNQVGEAREAIVDYLFANDGWEKALPLLLNARKMYEKSECEGIDYYRTWVLYSLGQCYEQKGQREDGRHCYEELVEKFSHSEEDGVRELVGKAQERIRNNG